MRRITLKDIAQRADVSHATVSMALRNLPKIPADTRKRIKKLAKEMGYTPDPMLGRLSAYRTKTISTVPKAAIAWINFWQKPEALEQNGTYNAYLKGACAMAKTLGYRVEPMMIHEAGMSLTRIESILHSRNITGLLIPPAETSLKTSLDLHWERYSVVKFGYTMSGINAHLVTNTQFETTRLVIRKALEKGYKRIGFHLASVGKERTGDNLLGGYLLESHDRPELNKIKPLILTSKQEAYNKKLFMSWFHKVKPDCILTQIDTVAEWLMEDDIKVPQDVAVFNFALPAANHIHYSGVQQNSLLIGQQAVAWLDRLLRHGLRGIPEKPLELLVEGDWIDGETG